MTVIAATTGASRTAGSTSAAVTTLTRFAERWTEADRLADAHVEAEAAGADAIVHWNDSLAGDRRRVEHAPFGVNYAGASEIRGEGRAIIEDRITVQVLTECDVEWRTGTHRHDRADAKSPRGCDAADQEQTLTDIERSTTVLIGQAVLIDRETGVHGIRIRPAQNIEAAQGELGRHTDVRVGNEL